MTMELDCIFCKIVNKKIPASILFENDTVLAFRDIEQKAPEHILVIPKAHVPSIMEQSLSKDTGIWDAVLDAIQTIAKDLNLDINGFRIVNNMGLHGGQTVDHLHFHVLGGRQMNWPPG